MNAHLPQSVPGPEKTPTLLPRLSLTAETITVMGGEGRSCRLDAVSLRVEEPGITAVVGPNGAGKSTLLRSLGGLIRPERGVVRLGEQPLLAWPAPQRAKHVALVGPNAGHDVALTVEETVALGRLCHRLSVWNDPASYGDPAVEAALARTDLGALRHIPLTEISSGERQRVHLARALAQEAQHLLLDEPTAYLDPGHALRVLGLVREMADEGFGIVMALHDLTSAGQYADRIVLMREGRIVSEGTPDAVLQAAVLFEAYGTHFRVMPHPDTGRPVVLPIP